MKRTLCLVVVLLTLGVTAVDQDAPAEEIKLGAVTKPDEARLKARNRTRRVLFNNDGGEPVVQMKAPGSSD